MSSSWEQRGIAEIELPFGQQTIRVPCQGGIPAWFKPVARSLVGRWGTAAGWDGYDAVPTNPLLVAELLNCLDLTMPVGASAPTITPLADGGLQAEWHQGESTLEIIARSDEPARFYFDSADENREDDGAFYDSIPLIRELIGHF